MTHHCIDPVGAADATGQEPRALSDADRREHTIIRNAQGQWVLLRHADVKAAAEDPASFSSAVSHHLQVPNGLDGVDHAAARATIEPFLSAEALAPFAPVVQEVARTLVAELPRGVALDSVNDLGAKFAVRAQLIWLGWPSSLEPRLLEWMDANHAATRSGDPQRTAVVAADFDAIIESVIRPRRELGERAPDDVTTRLMRATMAGRPLTDPEIVSILRNWTGGDLGSIALCVGVICAFLVAHPDVQQRLRDGVSDREFGAILDEILRIDDPFVSNRRKTTCPVHLGGVDIPAGEVVKLHWTSANRDAEAFGDPDEFAPERNAANNLVYGTGPHVCPGRGLATMEQRTITQELLAATEAIEAAGAGEREVSPVGGYRTLPIILR